MGFVSPAEEVVFFSPDGSASTGPGRSASSCVTTAEGFSFPFCAAVVPEAAADATCGGSPSVVFADAPAPPQPARRSTLSIPAMICSFFILYAAGWFPEGDGEWFESIDAGDIYSNLSYILGLTTDGEGYMKYAGNELEYTLSDLSVHISNNAIASGRSEGYLATATLHLEVPTRFAGRVLPPVSLNLQVQAKYIPKF